MQVKIVTSENKKNFSELELGTVFVYPAKDGKAYVKIGKVLEGKHSDAVRLVDGTLHSFGDGGHRVIPATSVLVEIPG